jgi:hypothetical protein
VIPLRHEGARYVVSTRGESEWVRNLRAAGAGELNGERFKAVEIPVEQRPVLIEAYRKQLGSFVDQYFNALPDAADHPIFKVEPA